MPIQVQEESYRWQDNIHKRFKAGEIIFKVVNRILSQDTDEQVSIISFYFLCTLDAQT